MNRHLLRLLLALTVLCAAVTAARAQERPPLVPGARIRVTVSGPGPRTQVGTFQALTDTTLQLQTGSGPLGLRLAAIDRLEVSGGRRLSIPGGVAGLVVGAVAGGALGCLANKDSYGVYCGGQDDTKVMLGAVVVGAAGAVLGAVLFGGERWTSWPLHR